MIRVSESPECSVDKTDLSRFQQRTGILLILLGTAVSNRPLLRDYLQI